MGCGAVLIELRRTQANGFSFEESVTLQQLEKAAAEGKISDYLISVDKVLGFYPDIHVTPAQSVRFKNGGALDLMRINSQNSLGLFRVYSDENEFLGVGEIIEGNEDMAVKRVYNTI